MNVQRLRKLCADEVDLVRLFVRENFGADDTPDELWHDQMPDGRATLHRADGSVYVTIASTSWAAIEEEVYAANQAPSGAKVD